MGCFAVCSFDGGTDRNCSVREKCVGTAKPGEHHKNHDAAADFEELEKGTLQLTDEVTTSAHARSMGGSQVFLEEGEKQTVETMIKCIVVASGNDASVAMAEHIAGTESEFVSRMNQKAKELGMNDTKFEDCCGLTDSDGHYTTAADVAKMSRELIERFPQILNYSSIWMEEITHVTQKGSKPFTLTNTNKLIRGYEGCVGLKTGSTSKAKYCVSAVAKKNDLTMLAVVMGAPDYKVRFADAASLFQYGFSSCSIYIDRERDPLPELSVVYGKQDTAELEYAEEFRYLTTGGTVIGEVEKRWNCRKRCRPLSRKASVPEELFTKQTVRNLVPLRFYMEQTWQEPACGICSDVR